MDLHLRQDPLCSHKHAWIGNDQSVRADFPQLFKIFLHSRKIVVMGEDIGCDVHLHAPLMGKGDPFPDLFICKIFSLRPESKGLASKINGVGSIDHSSL